MQHWAIHQNPPTKPKLPVIYYKYGDVPLERAVFSYAQKQGVKVIYKSCKHCGRIHEEDYICPKKPPRPPRASKPTVQYILRSTYKWGQTREVIRKRDMYLCQVCLR
ncbi:MAG: hypothetical protein LBR79_00460, partial [Oscillospiraceae bacterium]|nr:hypothetical protein [Oscillospiraceae bacterium]